MSKIPTVLLIMDGFGLGMPGGRNGIWLAKNSDSSTSERTFFPN